MVRLQASPLGLCAFTFAHLDGLDLSAATLDHASLTGASLVGADLTARDLTGATLSSNNVTLGVRRLLHTWRVALHGS